MPKATNDGSLPGPAIFNVTAVSDSAERPYSSGFVGRAELEWDCFVGRGEHDVGGSDCRRTGNVASATGLTRKGRAWSGRTSDDRAPGSAILSLSRAFIAGPTGRDGCVGELHATDGPGEAFSVSLPMCCVHLSSDNRVARLPGTNRRSRAPVGGRLQVEDYRESQNVWSASTRYCTAEVESGSSKLLARRQALSEDETAEAVRPEGSGCSYKGRYGW